jgi:FOG: Ankyrin repeat
MSELITASQNGNVKVVKELIQAGADVHVNEDEALRWASLNGHVEVVKELIQAGADVHTNKDVSLRLASQKGHTEVVMVLLQAGADVHTNEDSSLKIASQKGNIEVVKVLLQAGANVNNKEDEALCLASQYGQVEVVKVLLKAGANVHANDDHSLRLASDKGHTETIKVLLKAGANVHAKEDEALRWASENGHVEVVKVLLQAGANVISSDVFKKLCLQNTIVPEQTYGINELNFQAWVDRQSEQYKDIALIIKKNTRHISFTEFYNTIKSMVADLQLISKQYDQVYLVTGTDMRKSSFWVAMLVYKFLMEIHKEDLISKIIKDFMIHEHKNILYVYCDDASYSGSQLFHTLDDIQPEYSRDVFLLCPYISLKAKEQLLKWNKKKDQKLILSSSIQPFYSLEHCILSDPNISDKTELFKTFKKYS